MYNTNNLITTITGNMKKYRGKAGMTQCKMADGLAMHEHTYQQMESNGKGLESIVRLFEITNILQISIYDLLDGSIKPDDGSDAPCEVIVSHIKEESKSLSPKECSELSIYFAQRVHDTL
ncbi:MAG: helix-turn-helix transcriptional regulator [Lachnospiraceae bacterium]|nr:helix-turn-helix transcriptional regulator [Lachnospiraceae bacterium]